MAKKDQKVPLIYIKDDPYEGVLVREYNGIHGYTLTECHGYDAKGVHSHSAALRVAEVVKIALQEAVDASINPLRVAPPTPDEPKPCFEECPLVKLIQEMCNAKK